MYIEAKARGQPKRTQEEDDVCALKRHQSCSSLLLPPVPVFPRRGRPLRWQPASITPHPKGGPYQTLQLDLSTLVRYGMGAVKTVVTDAVATAGTGRMTYSIRATHETSAIRDSAPVVDFAAGVALMSRMLKVMRSHSTGGGRGASAAAALRQRNCGLLADGNR
ncbi:hypothetical protein EVAR_18621_1 [Eumeta japonica]|uniref:Uncharacterized protein n=1 Tax=Eumeta variegata TaxID=151549 RepID=A0A4C1U6U9_EUMVA|nr:hypothetical protein EVAR_18621_1 [Eumeta japonica]